MNNFHVAGLSGNGLVGSWQIDWIGFLDFDTESQGRSVGTLGHFLGRDGNVAVFIVRDVDSLLFGSKRRHILHRKIAAKGSNREFTIVVVGVGDDIQHQSFVGSGTLERND